MRSGLNYRTLCLVAPSGECLRGYKPRAVDCSRLAPRVAASCLAKPSCYTLLYLACVCRYLCCPVLRGSSFDCVTVRLCKCVWHLWNKELLYFYFTFYCAECPADFTHISSINGCYKVVTRNLEWSVAGLECRRLHKDAHLLVINDAAEQSAVAGMLASTNRQCYCIHTYFMV